MDALLLHGHHMRHVQSGVDCGADTLPLGIFPMLTTAAGDNYSWRGCSSSARASRVCAGNRRQLVSPRLPLRSHTTCGQAAKEQVQSLGGAFRTELPIEAKDAQWDAGGYATAQGEEFYGKQRELLGRVVGESDVVITAAVIPGKKSPVLVTADYGGGGWRPDR